MKPAVSLFGVSIEGKHPLDVVIKDTCSKTSLKVSLTPAGWLLLGPGVFIKVSLVSGVSVLAVDVKVLENVIEVERLVGPLSMPALRLPSEECRSVTKLVIFSSFGFI